MGLSETFESLSGSAKHQPEYELLQKSVAESEASLRATSDLLREKRHEKVKLKGLSEYQQQIERCIDEQKQTSELLVALRIYHALCGE